MSIAMLVLWMMMQAPAPLPRLCMALGPWDSCAEKPDVPAIQEIRQECKRVESVFVCPAGSLGGACPCGYSYQPVSEPTCTDKSRILLTDESGGKHCVKF